MTRPTFLFLTVLFLASCSAPNGIAGKGNSHRLKHGLATRVMDLPIEEDIQEEVTASVERPLYLEAIPEPLKPTATEDKSELPELKNQKKVEPRLQERSTIEEKSSIIRSGTGSSVAVIGTIPTPREHTETYAGLDSALEAMTSGLLVLLPLALVMMMSVPIGQHVRFEGGQNTMFIVAGLGLAALVALAVI